MKVNNVTVYGLYSVTHKMSGASQGKLRNRVKQNKLMGKAMRQLATGCRLDADCMPKE
jgi:hypothetical protein